MELPHEWLKRMGFGGRPEKQELLFTVPEGREAGVESPLTKPACQPQGAQDLRGYQQDTNTGGTAGVNSCPAKLFAVDEGIFFIQSCEQPIFLLFKEEKSSARNQRVGIFLRKTRRITHETQQRRF